MAVAIPRDQLVGPVGEPLVERSTLLLQGRGLFLFLRLRRRRSIEKPDCRYSIREPFTVLFVNDSMTFVSVRRSKIL